MPTIKDYRCCWNCKAFNIDGTRFVENASCRHPEVKAAMARKGVKHLDPDKLGNECPLFVRDINDTKKREKIDGKNQIPLQL